MPLKIAGSLDLNRGMSHAPLKVRLVSKVLHLSTTGAG